MNLLSQLSWTRRLAIALTALVTLWCVPCGVEGVFAQEAPDHKKIDEGAAKKTDKDHKTAEHKEPSAMDHVLDSEEFHFFDTLALKHIHIPYPLTKFMLLELLAAALVIAVYVPLARRLQSGAPPKGSWDNFFESLLAFVRDEVAKPSLGDQIADKYVPFLWTLFLFVLFTNLLGMVPFLGSATASIYVTAGLALIVFFAIHGSAIVAMGQAPDHHGHGHDDHSHSHSHSHSHGDHDHAEPGISLATIQKGSVRYAQSLWPQIDVPFPLGYFIKPLVFVIEVVGLFVRNAVLAVRLFANMFAGHMVLATILLFIRMSMNLHWGLWGAITFTSVTGILALSLLEIFVAFLQAYIFTFLTALFMGMAINPQH